MQKPKLSQEENKKVETILELYGDGIYRIAFFYLRDEFWAKDAVQDAFVKIINNIGKIGNPQSEGAKGYVHSIAGTVAKDYYRKKKNLQSKESSLDSIEIDNLPNLFAEDEGILEILASQEISEELHDDIRKLSPEDQAIIELRYGRDLSEKEIAEILDINYAAARLWHAIHSHAARIPPFFISKQKDPRRGIFLFWLKITILTNTDESLKTTLSVACVLLLRIKLSLKSLSDPLPEC